MTIQASQIFEEFSDKVLNNRRTFTLIAGRIPFVFVVPPQDFRVEDEQIMNSYNIIGQGEVVVPGQRKARRYSFSGFLPSIRSRFYSLMNPLPAMASKEVLSSWKDNKVELSFIIPEELFFEDVFIDKITFEQKDNTGDIYYNITLVEHRKPSNTSAYDDLFSRMEADNPFQKIKRTFTSAYTPTYLKGIESLIKEYMPEFMPYQTKSEINYLVKPGENVYTIAMKYYGDMSEWELVAKNNKIADPMEDIVGRYIII